MLDSKAVLLPLIMAYSLTLPALEPAVSPQASRQVPAQPSQDRGWAFISFDEVKSSRSRNYEIQSEVGARYLRQNHIAYSLKRDSRLFDSGSEFTDWIHRLWHSNPLDSNWYLDASIALSRSPTFSPNYRYELDLHTTKLKNQDWGLGLIVSNYRAENVMVIKPSHRLELSDEVSLTTKADLSVVPKLTVSAQSSVSAQVHPKYQHRLFVSAGKSYEGDGLTPVFYSVGTSGHISIQSRWMLVGSVSTHQSKIRSEWRFGGSMGAKF